MKSVSKSKIIAYRQCPKRLWLSVNNPELNVDSGASQAGFKFGHEVGEKAQEVYDPNRRGEVLNPFEEGFGDAIARTKALLEAEVPIFEATFSSNKGLVLVDAMIPLGDGVWKLVEVKSSTGVKDYYRDDVAFQTMIVREAGVNVAKAVLAHIDNQWTYQGDGDYRGLFEEADLTAEAFARDGEAKQWRQEALNVGGQLEAPVIEIGAQCSSPFDCGFRAHCESSLTFPEQPVSWLPNIRTKSLKTFVSDNPTAAIEDVPDALLNAQQQRVKSATVSGETYFDQEATRDSLAQYGWPAYFLDFETVNFAVPKWAGWRPYQQVPFQYSLHTVKQDGAIDHAEFLDISGNDPTYGFATQMIEHCGSEGPVFVYNAGFEKSRINELATRYPELQKALSLLNDRIVDLLPLARDHYYHPAQTGSWSIKNVLPTIAADLDYAALDEVQDGGGAMDAYHRAIAITDEQARSKIDQQLRDYCRLDTLAMVRIWEAFR